MYGCGPARRNAISGKEITAKLFHTLPRRLRGIHAKANAMQRTGAGALPNRSCQGFHDNASLTCADCQPLCSDDRKEAASDAFDAAVKIAFLSAFITVSQ